MPRWVRPGRQVPSGVVEVFRLLTVLFFAGLGYEAGRNSSSGHVLGVFNGVAVGVIVGSGVGYVIGGVLGRAAVSTAAHTETALRDTPAETLVAGGIGAVVGVLVGAGIGWPVFFIRQPLVAIALFGFLVAFLGYVGYRVGSSKRDGMLALFGDRAGMAQRPLPAAARPRVLDTSVAIDGRIVEVVRAGFLHGPLIVPMPVVGELQGLADAPDDLRRGRGRRGLQVLETLRQERAVDVDVVPDAHPEIPDVDAKLVRICLDDRCALLTLDTNLAKAAGLAGVAVMNLHALAQALRPPVTAGEDVTVTLLKPGREPGQAVGYLDDGTMVVVERARGSIGREVTARVTSVLTTSNGRMVFGQPAETPAPRSGAGE